MIFLLAWQAFFSISDAGLAMAILFFHHFFRLLASLDTGSTVLRSFANLWPKSTNSLHKTMNVSGNEFTEYAVCPKCHSIYDYDPSSTETKICEFIQFPNHTHKSRRRPCNTPLMNKVKTKNGFVLKPKKIYCYQSLISSIKRLFLKPGFADQCEHWRKRCSEGSVDYLGDVYDGKVWKDFQYYNGEPFLAAPHNLSLSLNIDWFNPYSHTEASVGAIYIVIHNLPREVRYKVHNVILCGIIPGPREPPGSVASYISPLVNELELLWKGVKIFSPSTGNINVRAALLCTASDLPATRKLLGFASYSAHYGCSKCKVYFPSIPDPSIKKLDYSNFDCQNWEPRDLSTHHTSSDDFLRCKTKAGVKTHISEGGVRYCPLIRLPYFDPIRFHVVDPMHNLLLGTAKNMLETWIEKNILNKKGLKAVQEIVESLRAPVDVGRLGLKISSSFGGFKADQWRSWTVLFSPIALKSVIPNEHLRCWLLFVKACQILCGRVIRRQDIVTAHNYLRTFCLTFCSLYGPESCTPNHHMHLYLKECLLDYGPSSSFWCYSFERYNGILGHYQTNNIQIGPQIMSKFIRDQQIRSVDLPTRAASFSDDISDLFTKMSMPAHSSGLSSVSSSIYPKLAALKIAPLGPMADFKISSGQGIFLLPPVSQIILKTDQLNHLKELLCSSSSYTALQPFLRVCRRSSRVCFGGELIGSKLCKSDRSSCIAAFWPVPSLSSSLSDLNVGFVQFFIEYTISVSPSQKDTFIFAYVQWLKQHTKRSWFGSTAVVSSVNSHPKSMYSFIPVQRISHRCTHGTINVDFDTRSEHVSVAVPMDSKTCF